MWQTARGHSRFAKDRLATNGIAPFIQDMQSNKIIRIMRFSPPTVQVIQGADAKRVCFLGVKGGAMLSIQL